MTACFTSGHIQINFDFAKEITFLIINTFKERQGIYEEGINAISSLALSIGVEFDPILRELFGVYLIHALKSNEESLCKVAIMSTSELIRSLESSFELYISEIFPIIIEILNV